MLDLFFFQQHLTAAGSVGYLCPGSGGWDHRFSRLPGAAESRRRGITLRQTYKKNLEHHHVLQLSHRYIAIFHSYMGKHH